MPESVSQLYLRLKNGAVRLQMMRRMLAIGVALLAVLWIASPALACLLPGRAMTVAEHACCKKMAKMCGSAHMPHSHSCCKEEGQPSNTSVLLAHHQLAPSLQIAALYVPSRSREFALPGVTLDRPPSDSPPDSSVLRI